MTKIRLLIILITLIVITLFGTVAIYYARGYRFGLQNNNVTLTPRGLLVANSAPTGAQVYIDGKLETATNNTLSLAPGTYEVSLKKSGYLSWQKQITIEKEVVTQIDAFLVPSAPSLTAVTFSGVFNPTLSQDFSKIAYGVPLDGENSENAGLWVLETVNLPLGFNRDPRLITDGDFTGFTWEWAPDGREVLVATKSALYRLPTSEYTREAERINVLPQKDLILKEWEEEKVKRLNSQLGQLPDELETIFKKSATNIAFSPDGNKILYTASGAASIPEGLVRPFPGASTQTQERELKDGKHYVYDIKEDRNFAVGDGDQKLSWLPNSLNLLLPEKDRIIVMDYDGTNKLTVYSGNYTFPHAYPSTSTNRILILTNFGASSALPNLYWLTVN